MLKLIHTADWHLGQQFFGYDREEEHDAFLFWLLDTLESRQADVLLVAGDLFDTANPPASAQRRFYRFLRDASRRCPGLQIVLIAGNHDSAARLEAPVPLLEEMRVTVVGSVPRKETGEIDFASLLIPLYNKDEKREAWCLAIPYLRQGDYPPAADAGKEDVPADPYAAGIARMYRAATDYALAHREEGEALVALGHLHAVGAELSADDRSERVLVGGLDAVAADAFPPELDYTALGHIHKAQRIGGRETVRYAGSPLPMSFSEQHYRHQVVCATIDGGRCVSVEPLEIPRCVELLRVPKQADIPQEVIGELLRLPERDGESSGNRDPYLEVRVLFSEPDPSFRHRVEEALSGKAVRLASISITYPRQDGDRENGGSPVYGDLQRVDPLELLDRTYRLRYGSELPKELADVFLEVIKEEADGCV